MLPVVDENKTQLLHKENTKAQLVQQGWSCCLILHLDCPAVILALGIVVVVVILADLVRGEMPVSR